MKSAQKNRHPNGPRGTKTARVVTITIAVILVLALAATAAVYTKLRAITQGSVAIVTRPSGSTATTIPTPSTTLPPIDGTPDDLDKDYDVDVDAPSEQGIYQKVPIDANVINIVMLSSDARPGEKVGRSDSMLIFSYNRKKSTIKLVSVMRDTWVPIAGHAWNRINAAYAFGGVGLAVNTVNDNFDLDIQNYVTIRFEQFISIVDQLGGVSIKLSKAEIDYINKANPTTPLDTEAGVKQLNGAQTLTHCRNRKVGNGDFDRTRRQRDTMLAILQKMKQQRNPVALARLIGFALDNVSTNIKGNELFTLALEALNAEKLTLDEARIPFDKTWHYANESGRSVIAIDIAKNTSLLHTFLYG